MVTLNTALYSDTCLRVASILSIIGKIDGNEVVTYPQKDSFGDILAFPEDIDTNLPFWFVIPENLNNLRTHSIGKHDYGDLVLRIELYLARVTSGWPGEYTGKALEVMGQVQAGWSTYVSNNLEYDDGEVSYDYLMGINQVSGISWPNGVAALSGSPLRWSEEQYVGLRGNIIFGVDNRFIKDPGDGWDTC